MTNALQIQTQTPEEQRLVDGAIAMLSAQGLLTKFDENQQKAFVMTCMAIGVNPLLKEAYAVPYEVYDAETRTKVKTLGIIIDYKVYLARAERSTFLDGWETKFEGTVVKKRITKRTRDGKEFPKVVIDQEKTTLSGTITIWRKDWKKPFKSRPLFLLDEMKDTDFWHDDPYGMLEKALIREFFQKVFPKDCDLPDYSRESRIYSAEPHEVEITDTKPTVSKQDVAQAYRNALDALNGLGLPSRTRDEFNDRIKQAMADSDLGALGVIANELIEAKEHQEAKALEQREETPRAIETPAEVVPEPEKPAEDSPEMKGKTAVLTVLRSLKAKGWNEVHIKNSLKKHLSLDVADGDDWEAMLWKADFDRAVYLKAYKHWHDETKKAPAPEKESPALTSCREAVKEFMGMLDETEHQEWIDALDRCQNDNDYAELEKLAKQGIESNKDKPLF